MGRSNRAPLRIVAAASAILLLAGCVPQSRESFERYVAALDAVPGVSVAYSGVSTPLPFAVHGSVEVELAADDATWLALREAACTTEVNASVSLSATLRAGASTVSTAVRTPCERDDFGVVGLATAVGPHAVDLGLAFLDDAVTLRSDGIGGVAEALAVSQAAMPSLSGWTWSVALGDLRLSGDATELVAHVETFDAMTREFAIMAIDLTADALVIQTTAGSDADALREWLLARDPARYGAVDLVVTAVDAGTIPSGTSPATVRLRDAVVTELGYDVRLLGTALYVTATSPDEVVAMSAAIADLNTESVEVGISIFENEVTGAPSFGVRPAPVLTPTANPYPAWIAQYERLAATGLVQTVSVATDAVEAWIVDERYDDRAAFAEVKKVLDALGDEYGLARWGLNNRELSPN